MVARYLVGHCLMWVPMICVGLALVIDQNFGPTGSKGGWVPWAVLMACICSIVGMLVMPPKVSEK